MTLHGSGTQADNDALSYAWTQTAGGDSDAVGRNGGRADVHVAGDGGHADLLARRDRHGDEHRFGADSVTITVDASPPLRLRTPVRTSTGCFDER